MGAPSTLIPKEMMSIYNVGTQCVQSLFDNQRVFDNVKPVDVITYITNMAAERNSIILDFFSGSATTAEAVMRLNAKRNLHLKYIMVQLPEDLDESVARADSRAQKTLKNAIAFLDTIHKPHTICEIGKERLRRAGAKIKNEAPSIDEGFRVLTLNSTNMKDVYYSADEFTQNTLFDLESNIKEDRTSLDLLFGCLLEWGLPLSLPYTSEQIEGCTVHTYNDGDLIACFDENVPDSVIKTIARRQPLRAVFRDSSFADSPAKINVGEIFKLLAPDTRVKVI